MRARQCALDSYDPVPLLPSCLISVGTATGYAYSVKKPPLRCVLWERNVRDSIERASDGIPWGRSAFFKSGETTEAVQLVICFKFLNLAIDFLWCRGCLINPWRLQRLH